MKSAPLATCILMLLSCTELNAQPQVFIENLCEHSVVLRNVVIIDGKAGYCPQASDEWKVAPAQFAKLESADHSLQLKANSIKYDVVAPDGIILSRSATTEGERLSLLITEGDFATQRNSQKEEALVPDLRYFFSLHDCSKSLQLGVIKEFPAPIVAQDTFLRQLKRIPREGVSQDLLDYADDILSFADAAEKRANNADGVIPLLVADVVNTRHKQSLFERQQEIRKRLEKTSGAVLPFVFPMPIETAGTVPFLFSKGSYLYVGFGGFADLGATAVIYSTGHGSRKVQQNALLQNDPSKVGWTLERNEFVVIKTDLGISVFETNNIIK